MNEKGTQISGNVGIGNRAKECQTPLDVKEVGDIDIGKSTNKGDRQESGNVQIGNTVNTNKLNTNKLIPARREWSHLNTMYDVIYDICKNKK